MILNELVIQMHVEIIKDMLFSRNFDLCENQTVQTVCGSGDAPHQHIIYSQSRLSYNSGWMQDGNHWLILHSHLHCMAIQPGRITVYYFLCCTFSTISYLCSSYLWSSPFSLFSKYTGLIHLKLKMKFSSQGAGFPLPLYRPGGPPSQHQATKFFFIYAKYCQSFTWLFGWGIWRYILYVVG